MNVGILKADYIRPKLASEYGDYPELIAGLFHRVDPQIRFRTYEITRGVWPESASDADAWLITGSRYGAYDSLDWIGRLKQWVIRLHLEQRKMIGICFGHQLIIDALGGEVTKADEGWNLGRQVMTLNDSVTTDLPDRLAIPFFHQDQVVRLPGEMVCLASTPRCRYAVCQMEDHVITVQGHPEYSNEFSRALYQLRQTEYPQALRDEALDSLMKPSDQHRVAVWLTSFLNN